MAIKLARILLKMTFSCCRLEVEVAYYEKQHGVLVKVTEVLVNAKDDILSEVLMSALPEVRRRSTISPEQLH